MKTKTNIKRTSISMLLIVALLITMAVPAFADEQLFDSYDDVYLSNSDITFVERERGRVNLQELGLVGVVVQEQYLGTLVFECGTTEVSTFIENEDGSFTALAYRDGVLIEMHSTVPGSGVVETSFVNNGDRNDVFSVIFVVNENVGADISPMSVTPPVRVTETRTLGHAQHTHHMTGQLMRIRGEVTETTTTNGQVRVVTNQTWTTTVGLATVIASGLGGSILSAYSIVLGLAARGVILIAAPSVVALTQTTLTGWAVESTIRAFPTHGGGRNHTFARNYRLWASTSCGVLRNFHSVDGGPWNATHWGQNNFGMQMFLHVFGLEINQITWTN